MGETGERLHQNQNILRMKTASGLEEVYYPVFHEGLPEEYKILVEQDLGETETEKENGLLNLKELMKTKGAVGTVSTRCSVPYGISDINSYVKCAGADLGVVCGDHSLLLGMIAVEENLSATDDLLITVLRGCKYNLQKSRTKLKNFLRSRQVIIDKLRRLDEKKIELILRDTLFTVLPYRDKNGRAIVITKPTISFDKYSMDDIEPVVTSFFLYLLTFPMTNVCGVAYIAEASCDPLFIFRVSKSFRSYIHYGMNFPMRIARTDIVNETFVFRCLHKALYPLLPEKYRNRILFHGNSYERLHSIYHPDILPQDLGGNLGPISDEFYRERMMSFMRTLKEEVFQD